MSRARAYWEARQLKGRLRDDTHQLEQLAAHSDLDHLLLPPLWELVISYWSEDPRIVDLITRGSWNSAIIVENSGHLPTIIYASIYWEDEVNGFTNEWTSQIHLRIMIEHDGIYKHYWRYGDVFSALLILPLINYDGRDVPLEYPKWTTTGIMTLRNILYNART